MLSFAIAFLSIPLVCATKLMSISRANLSEQTNITGAITSLEPLQDMEGSTNRPEVLFAPINPTNSSHLQSNDMSFTCDSHYGRGNFAESCLNAIYRASFGPGPASRQVSWGQRDEGNFDVPLPQKVASCERFVHFKRLRPC